MITFITAFALYSFSPPYRQGMMIWTSMPYQGGCHAVLEDLRGLQKELHFTIDWFECSERRATRGQEGNG